jgi:hypothetical protein
VPIPPRVAARYHRPIDVNAIAIQCSHLPAIAVGLYDDNTYVVCIDEACQGSPCGQTLRLVALGRVDAIQPDFILCVVYIQQGDGITISDIDDASCEVELRVVPEPLELAGSGVAGGGVVTDIDSRALVGAARSLRVTSEQATS